MPMRQFAYLIGFMLATFPGVLHGKQPNPGRVTEPTVDDRGPPTPQQAEALAEFVAAAAPRLKNLTLFARTARNRMQRHPATAAADSIFLDFRDECLRLEHELSELLPADSPLQEALLPCCENRATGSLRATLRRHGFDVVDRSGEGIFSVEISNESLVRRFGSLLTPATRRYLNMRAAEQRGGFTGDGALLISWDELADRIANWERFLRANPDFVLAREAAGLYETYVNTYLTGTHSSRVFRSDDDVLEPEVRSSYERFLAKYAGTKAAALLEEYYEVLRRSEFTDGPAVQTFLGEYRVPSMMGVQPPLR